MVVELAPTWADLVFHVLAHVEAPVPSGLFDADYVAFAAYEIGAPGQRELAEDARTLRAVGGNHMRFARLQALAWVFRSPAEALRVKARDLAELGPEDVADGEALRLLATFGPEAEVLRSAAELEAEHHARLPPPVFDAAELGTRLRELSEAAPALVGLQVACARALGRRGRVRRREIWVGAPLPKGGPSLEHLAFQAAHEATVAELAELAPASSADDRPLEAAALVLFGLRAERTGLGARHARWLGHFAAGRASGLDALPEPWREQVRSLAGR